MGPEDLLNQARKNPRLIESTIINYIRHLAEDEKLMHKTIHVHCYAIFHFLEMNDINLNKKKIKRFVPPDESSQDDRAYTHEEIANILLKCDDRARVIILLMTSTGMRVGAIHTLQIKDLVKIKDYSLYKITVYSNSPRDRYYTFCTPECATAIDSYLDYRTRLGEIITSHAPLVREQFDINDHFHIVHPYNLKHDTVTYIIKQVLNRSGKKIGEVMQTHGFRKFAITMMKKATVDFSDREYLVGHKHSRGLDANYDRTTEEDRLREYLKAVDLLTISPENRLRKKVAEHEYTIQHKLAEKDKQIEEMMSKQEQFEQLIQSLIDSGQLTPTVK